VAERSFANNVAKMAGIPQSVIEKAERRADGMQK
jgi:DNA mismatch repair ATPase MutS